MQFKLPSVLLAFGLMGMASASPASGALASRQYELGDVQCYATSALCDNASTNSGCTGCTYDSSSTGIPYCCTVTKDPNAKRDLKVESRQYELGDKQCYATSALCDNASTNSGCTGCTYYSSSTGIPYCCTVTVDPNSKL
ncbi:hypothetical protein N0V82_003130 [Gnomoniopsis sp. IMI 355080]|nr:hypothetical protein N0V82_003130 [Gnomoniopsis sp. IMI 355080]